MKYTQWALARIDDRGPGVTQIMQGSLTIAISEKNGPLDASVLDRDDDGETRARYANLGAFVDALLGTWVRSPPL